MVLGHVRISSLQERWCHFGLLAMCISTEWQGPLLILRTLFLVHLDPSVLWPCDCQVISLAVGLLLASSGVGTEIHQLFLLHVAGMCFQSPSSTHWWFRAVVPTTVACFN